MLSSSLCSLKFKWEFGRVHLDSGSKTKSSNSSKRRKGSSSSRKNRDSSSNSSSGSSKGGGEEGEGKEKKHCCTGHIMLNAPSHLISAARSVHL